MRQRREESLLEEMLVVIDAPDIVPNEIHRQSVPIRDKADEDKTEEMRQWCGEQRQDFRLHERRKLFTGSCGRPHCKFVACGPIIKN